MPRNRDCGYTEIAVPLQRETLINLKREKVMKQMCNMRMREYCCSQMMMAMTMKGSVYIIGINETKKKKYEKNSISNSSLIKYQHQQHLG
jgi:hypothetical protein